MRLQQAHSGKQKLMNWRRKGIYFPIYFIIRLQHDKRFIFKF
jgi:hypothetical protein